MDNKQKNRNYVVEYSDGIAIIRIETKTSTTMIQGHMHNSHIK